VARRARARASEAIRLASIMDALDEPLTIDRSVEVLTEMFFDKTVADPLYDLALFEMFMEATRNVTVRDEARG
jgi:TetR/AcrR family transcriptional regulator, regulator of biofilm formation and stress response